MIRILFYIDTLNGGGAEKVLCNLVNSMDQTRFDITVQTTWREENTKYLASGIRYRWCFIKNNQLINLLFRVEAAISLLYRIHIKDDYDIEVAYLECSPTKIMSASTNRKSKKLAWVHCDLKKAMADTESFIKKTKPWYKKYHKIVCVSENVRCSYREMFGDNPESIVLYNTIDHEEILHKADYKLSIRKRKFTLVIIGRLSPPKKIMRLLQAHNMLITEGFDYDLWIIGEGDERQMLENYIAEYNLENSVVLLGFQDNPYPFIKAADLLVCSSVYEGFSTFITEGLILGKPIVTTDCSGMRELLGDSEYGLITENSDKGFYEGLKRMLTDTKLLEYYATQAKKRGQDFKREKLVNQTENFFMQLLK